MQTNLSFLDSLCAALPEAGLVIDTSADAVRALNPAAKRMLGPAARVGVRFSDWLG